MSASSWIDRIQSRAEDLTHDELPPRGWIGIDVSGERERRGVRVLLPLLIIALVTSLGIAALRIDLIRTRYAVAANSNHAMALIEAQRALIVRRRQLRDPVELAQQARARGFRPPAHVLIVPDPLPAGPWERNQRSDLPAVSAGPPNDPEAGEWQ